MYITSSVLLFTTFVAGCTGDSRESSDSPGISVIIAPLSSEGCEESPNGQSDFPPDVEKFIVDVTGSGGFTATVTQEQLDSAGRVLVAGVPPGEDLTLNLYGCNAANELTWSGRVPGLTVRADDKVAPRLYFTRKDAMSCTGAADVGGQTSDSLTTPRMLHNSVRIGSDVFIFGGFDTYQPNQTPPSLEASSTEVIRYDASRGAFRVLSSTLSEGRGMAHALPIDGGSHILIIGGAHRAQFAQSPPLKWDQGSVDSLPIEIIDVDTESVESANVVLPNLPYSAATVNAAGTEFVVLGGQNADGQPTSSLHRVKGGADAILAGTATIEVSALSFDRMGATAHFLPNGSDVVVIGGAADSDNGALAELLISDGASKAIELTDSAFEPFALHASALISSDDCRHVIAIAGGVDLERADPDAPRFLSPSASEARLALLTLNLCDSNAPVGRLEDQSSALASDVRSRRIFHRLDSLDGGALLLSGGYNQIGQPNAPVSADCDQSTSDTGCWLNDVTVLQSAGTIDALSLIEYSRGTMSPARFGHSTTLLPDGSVLFTGGMRQLAVDPQSISAASELYNPLLPVDSGRCN